MTMVDFDLGQYLFRATGSVLLFDGYHVLYTEGREKEEGKTMDDLPPIPPLGAGDQVEVREITPTQHFTEPPPRFSEASLVKELERLGIGRPSTYSAIISTLTAREYVKVDQRRFFPTELGETVEKIMVGKFPDIFNVEFTAEMETELDRIEEGELGWQRVLQDFYGPFTKALDAVDMNALVADAHGLNPEELAKERCPKCGTPVELRTGRFGPYLACVKYKDTCDYVKSLKKDKVPDRPTDEKCHLCGSPMVIKTGRFGEFLACTTLSQRARAPARSRWGSSAPSASMGDLAERRTKRGKSFWGCLRYPACDFSTWNRPVPETCPACGWLGMEKKISKAEGETRTCLKCGHQIVARRAGGGGAGVTAVRDRGRRRPRRLGGGLGPGGARRAGHAVRDAAGGPRRRAHRTDRLAELVCSNSFKSVELSNAHGLLKAELRALVGATVHQVTLNGVALDPADVRRQPHPAARPRGRERARRRRRLPLHATPARACTASSTPSTSEVYLYTQFEVPDSRRVFAVFEQPDLKAHLPLHRHRARALGGRVQLRHARAGRRSATARRPGSFEPTPRISSYITALVAGPYAVVRDELTSRRRPRRSRSASSAASRSSQYLDADYIFEKTKQGFAYFEEKFGCPYPFAKYDQLFVPEFNAGAMENAGAVTFTETYVFRSQGDRMRVRSAASSRSCTSSPTCGSATS